VVEDGLRVLGPLDLAEVDLPRARAQEDAAPVDRRVQQEPGEVATTSSGARKSGMPGRPSMVAISWKTWWAKTSQARSISRGPRVAISQSRTATVSKSRYIMLPIRESPQTSTGSPSSAGRFASSQARPRSMSGERGLASAVVIAYSYQARVLARLRASGVAPSWPVTAGSRKPNVVAASGMPCSRARTSTVLRWSRSCCSGEASKSQLSPNG